MPQAFRTPWTSNPGGEPKPERERQGRARGRGGGLSPRVKFIGTVGTSFPQWRGLGSTLPARPLEAATVVLRYRPGSSPRQVLLGLTRPGGCKPQAKVERGWSYFSNPFYTVKTAKLSPRRPLLIGRQTDEKPKQTSLLTSLPPPPPMFFLLNKKAGSLEGKLSALTFALFGA